MTTARATTDRASAQLPVPFLLPGSLPQDLPSKMCTSCKQERSSSGGVQTSPNKWRCANCWRGFIARK